jgi:hypothetical protein
MLLLSRKHDSLYSREQARFHYTARTALVVDDHSLLYKNKLASLCVCVYVMICIVLYGYVLWTKKDFLSISTRDEDDDDVNG